MTVVTVELEIPDDDFVELFIEQFDTGEPHAKLLYLSNCNKLYYALVTFLDEFMEIMNEGDDWYSTDLLESIIRTGIDCPIDEINGEFMIDCFFQIFRCEVVVN